MRFLAVCISKFKFIPILGFLLLAVSCEQYAIFDDIANEIEPKPAKIQGSLSKIAAQGGTLYVANGSLWRFSGGSWDKDGGAPSSVFSVANSGSVIFVPETKTVYQGGFGSWSPVDGTWTGTIAGIFDGPSYLSVDNGKYYLTGASGGNSLIPDNTVVNDKSGSLIATTNGLYNNGSLIGNTSGYNVLGVLSGTKFGDIAVTSGGHLIVGGDVHSLDKAFTGALAEDERGILAGMTKGYCVIKKNENGYAAESPDDGSSYGSTIGLRRVTSLAVSGGLIFACVVSSTLKRSGLMSYRNGQWNMEQ